MAQLAHRAGLGAVRALPHGGGRVPPLAHDHRVIRHLTHTLDDAQPAVAAAEGLLQVLLAGCAAALLGRVTANLGVVILVDVQRLLHADGAEGGLEERAEVGTEAQGGDARLQQLADLVVLLDAALVLLVLAALRQKNHHAAGALAASAALALEEACGGGDALVADQQVDLADVQSLLRDARRHQHVELPFLELLQDLLLLLLRLSVHLHHRQSPTRTATRTATASSTTRTATTASTTRRHEEGGDGLLGSRGDAGVVEQRAIANSLAVLVQPQDVRALLLLAHERRRANQVRAAQVVQNLLHGAAVLCEHDHARVAACGVVAAEVVQEILLQLLQLRVHILSVVNPLEHAVIELHELRRRQELHLRWIRLPRRSLRPHVVQRLRFMPCQRRHLHERTDAVLGEHLARLDQREQ